MTMYKQELRHDIVDNGKKVANKGDYSYVSFPDCKFGKFENSALANKDRAKKSQEAFASRGIHLPSHRINHCSIKLTKM